MKEFEANQIFHFPISSAVVFKTSDLEITDDDIVIKFGEPDEEFKFGMFVDSLSLASKDGKEFVIAVGLYDVENRLLINPIQAALRKEGSVDL